MIGLDFGTTNSCAAFADAYLGEVTPISVAPLNTRPYDSVLASSVLDPAGDEPVIGKRAEAASRLLTKTEREETSYLTNFKTYLDDQRLRHKRLVVADTERIYDGLQQIDVERHTYREEWVGGNHTREQLVTAVAALTKHLLASAAEQTATLDRLLLGTPVTFSSRARKRMIASLFETGQFASYRELLGKTRFIPEPVAAAAAGMREAFDADDREIVVVFDHGGGTLDISLIEFERVSGFDFPVPVREVAPPVGDRDVAGGAFDKALRTELCEDGDVRRALEALPLAEALERVRDVKEQLSVSEDGVLALEGGGVDVARRVFERAAAPLLGEIERQLLRLLDRADLEATDIDRVLLTGGSSLIPAVQERVRKIFPGLHARDRVRAYDPSESGDVERAITEIAQGLAFLGGDDEDIRRLVLWDVELLDSEGRSFRSVAARGEPYGKGADGRPELKKRIEITDNDRDGIALGLWEARLDKRAFLFGLAEIPPLDRTVFLDIALRPDGLYPTMHLVNQDGTRVERSEEFGWPANRKVAADIGDLSEGQLAEFFEQDEVDYVPTAPFRQFRKAPMTRLVAVGDRIEWVDTTAKGSFRARSGEVIAIRAVGSHDPLEEVAGFDLTEYHLRVRVDSTGGTVDISPPFGTIRISPRT